MISGFFQLISNVIFLTSHIDTKGGFPKPLNRALEKQLIDAAAQGDKEAKDSLIKHNMRLVIHIVKKFNNYHDIDELVSVGSIGLIKAINTFTSDKNTQLATYAARCIENEILMTLRANKKHKNNKSLYEPVSFDKDGNEITLIDVIPQDEDSVLESVANKITAEKLKKVIDNALDEREKSIITARYGLGGAGAYTQLEISKAHNISRSYVSRIEKRAINKIRKYIKVNKLLY